MGKALEKTELSVTNKEYKEVRDALRSPSMGTLRKYCNVLILNGEGTEKELLTTSYQKFVKTLETLDSQCNLAVRGKKNVEIYNLYRDSLKDLIIFEDTAEKVMGVTAEVAPEVTPPVTTPEATPEATPEVKAE